jgi:hypothetical protein
MRLINCLIGAAIFWVAAQYLWALQAAVVPQIPPKSPEPVAGELSAIIKDLSSTDFTVRENAQRELSQIPWQRRNELLRLAEKIPDEEVKTRLMARVESIDDSLAGDPPPISLEVQGASLLQTHDALKQAMGIPLYIWPENERSRARYTINAQMQPFWTIFDQLGTQHGIILEEHGESLLLQDKEPGLRAGFISGPLAIFPDKITRHQEVNLRQPAARQIGVETLTLQVIVALDPRIKVVKWFYQFTDITDDQGNVLFHLEKQPSWNPRGFYTCVNLLSAPLSLPQRHGKTIASAKGIVRYIAQSAETKVSVPNGVGAQGQDLYVGPFGVHFTEVHVEGDYINLQMYPVQMNEAKVSVPAKDSSPVNVTVIDAAGLRLDTTTLADGVGAGMRVQFTPPISLELSVPTRMTKEIAIPFELNGLILPP